MHTGGGAVASVSPWGRVAVGSLKFVREQAKRARGSELKESASDAEKTAQEVAAKCAEAGESVVAVAIEGQACLFHPFRLSPRYC